MSLVGQLLHTSIQTIPQKTFFTKDIASQQIKALKKLLLAAQRTEFGKRFDFDELIKMKDPRAEFAKWIPVYTYDRMQREWWHRSRNDQRNITWPGIVPYYGLSSGTTQASSKYIPVTQESLSAWNKISKKIFFNLKRFHNVNAHILSKQSLMVGGSESLIKEGKHFIGDNSGIMARHRPLWLSTLYRPESRIQLLPEWEERMQAIFDHAPQWDIAFIVGNIAWIQLICEKVMQQYGLHSIQEIWPHLTLLINSGIHIDPYVSSFDQLLDKPIHYLNIYSATEGILAYQDTQSPDLKLITNQNIYFEFIPFNEVYFKEDGTLINEYVQTIPIEEVRENVDYALLISTSSGAWHYSIGDVIRFTDKEAGKIKIIGRTKDQISLTGEHLTVDHIHKTIQYLNDHYQLEIQEYMVTGQKTKSVTHTWYVSSNQSMDPKKISQYIDAYLKSINDDYAVQRSSLVDSVEVKQIPVNCFYQWLASRGKLNGQAKLPRIASDDLRKNWESFLSSYTGSF